MLFDTEDVLVVDIVSRLISAESEDVMKAGFEELERLFEVRQRDFQKAVAKERKEKDLPMRVGESELEQAAAEWGMEMPKPKGQEGPK